MTYWTRMPLSVANAMERDSKTLDGLHARSLDFAPRRSPNMHIARLAAAVALAACAATAAAQQKEIKIGFIYDVSGPFAGGGSEPAQVGTKAAIDYVNERG